MSKTVERLKRDRSGKPAAQSDKLTIDPPDLEVVYVGHPLLAEDIEKFGRQIQGFQPVLTTTNIPAYLRGKPRIPPVAAYVLFIPPDGKGSVGHFVGLVLDAQMFREVSFYDSFGRTPKELGIEVPVENLISYWLEQTKPSHMLKFKVNRVPAQTRDENMCGSYTLTFIIDRLINRRTFREATHFDSRKRDAIGGADRRIVRLRSKKFSLV